ncbi:MAG: acyltransferase family protein [Isosphaeraceae bacterium]
MQRNPMSLAALCESRAGNNFDFLRLNLALLVIVSHSWLLIGRNPSDPMMLATHGQMDSGAVAVNAFFIISGFLIAQSWTRSSGWRDFLARRVLRIYPGFLMAAALSALIFAPMIEPDPGAYWRSFDPSRFLLGLLELRMRTPETVGVNGSLWTVRYEFLCYLGIMGLGLARALPRRGWILGVLAATMAALAAQEIFGLRVDDHRAGWVLGYFVRLSRLSSNFLAGTVFFLYRDRVVLSARGTWLAASAFAAMAAQPWVNVLPAAFPVVGGYLVLAIAYLPARWMHDWARRCDLSYGIYLYGYPIQQVVILLLGGPTEAGRSSLSPWVVFAASVPPTVLAAAASWWLVEAPTMRVRRALAERFQRLGSLSRERGQVPHRTGRSAVEPGSAEAAISPR